MKKFFEISMGQHHLGNSNIKRSVVGKGEASVSAWVYISIYDIIPTLLAIGLPVVFLTVRAPVIALSVIVAIVIFSFYTIVYNGRFVKKLKSIDEAHNSASKTRGEFLQNADVVFINAQEVRVRQENAQVEGTIGLQGRPLWTSYIGWFHFGQWFISISQALCICFAGYMTWTGHISSGLFITLILWIQSSLGTLTNISQIQRNLAKNIAPVLKYFKFLDFEPDVKVPEKPIPLKSLNGRIDFKVVSFSYSPSGVENEAFTDTDKTGDNEVEVDDGNGKNDAENEAQSALRNVSFVLEAGKRYAFVGTSGAGKSTLVNLILRAFDTTSGSVEIDGINIKYLDYHELRRHIGLVPQDVALFDQTLRYNVTFGLENPEQISGERLDHVARLSRMNEFWSRLDKGWDTLIGERGVRLSGGQRQRVGIARALIREPKILIFDEATSSLDTENEAIIRQSIHEASVGKTTIIIAHRLATVRDVDCILVFDNGSLVGQGTHDELIQSNEIYQRLVKNQVIGMTH
jgi:ABC-type multidrug transport system fused ATPase/permease subunit